MARFLVNRLIPTITQKNTSESQCGFRSDKRTADMIFVLRQIQEEDREQNTGLYAAFTDLAFDIIRSGISPSFTSSTKVSKVRCSTLGQVSKVRCSTMGQVSKVRCSTLGQVSKVRCSTLGQVSKVRCSTRGHCPAAVPSPTASSRGTSWTSPCSLCSSASCSMRQRRTCQTASTSFPNRRQSVQPSPSPRTHENH